MNSFRGICVFKMNVWRGLKGLKWRGVVISVEKRLFSSKESVKAANESATPAAGQQWNEAACVMALAPMNNSEPFSLGYLLVERSGTGRVMPGNWVYPGGNAAGADADLGWIPFFKDTLNLDIEHKRIFKESAKIPEIYEKNDADRIRKEISLRITAIREMFEEAGVLLCRPRNIIPERHVLNGRLHYEFPELSDKKVLQEWQKKVRKNAPAFLDLCKELKCAPDIDSLHDWTNWLTPTVFKAKSRFDTIYFMTILPKMPQVVIDGNEAVNAQWASPSSILAEHAEGKIKLMPPQLYEMSRLKPLKTIGEVEKRLMARKELGIERFFPVFRKAKDGMLFILPGDDLYPQKPDYIGTEPAIKELDESISELNGRSKNLHRGVFGSDGAIKDFFINVNRFGNIY